MVSSNPSSDVPKPSHSSKFLGPRRNDLCKKASFDRHSKSNGKDRRIVLPVGCADRVFELKKRLGHRSPGQTVEWLLIQAKASVDAVLNKNPSTPQNGDEKSSSISMSGPLLTSASDVEISADEIARFLFGDHVGYTLELEEKQQKEKE